MTDVLLGRAAVDLVANTASFVRDMNAASKKFEAVGARMQAIGTQLSTTVTVPIVGIGVAAAKAFTDFETALTGVAKTVEAPQAEIEALGERFKALSEEIPVAANELLRIAELGGQLGIATSALDGFVDTISALGVSTNLSTEEAATSLARLANVLGTNQDEFDRLGSVIVDLGNNLATTEREIVQFAERMAGAGKIAGLTESDVLAIGGALSSVGVEAEAGGTAVQKVLLELNDAVARGNDSLAVFADVAGMTASDFAATWRADASAAFDAFVQGLGRAGDDATKVLEDLGLENARTTRAFLSLANAGPLLTDALERGSQAWEENTALSEEASRFYDRLGADFATLANQARNVAAELGAALAPAFSALIEAARGVLDVVRGLIERFAALPESTRTTIAAFAALAATVGPLLIALGAMVKTLSVIGALQLAGSVLSWARAFGSLAVSVRSARDALALLQVALGPTGWVIAGLTAAAAAFLLFKRRADAARESVQDFENRLASLTVSELEAELSKVNRELIAVSQTIAAAGRQNDGSGLEFVNQETLDRFDELKAKAGVLGTALKEARDAEAAAAEEAERLQRMLDEAAAAAAAAAAGTGDLAKEADSAAEALEGVLRSFETLTTRRAVEILNTRGIRDARRDAAKRVQELRNEQAELERVRDQAESVAAEFERTNVILERSRENLKAMYETDAANLENAFLGAVRAIGEAFGDLGRSIAMIVDQLVDVKVSTDAETGESSIGVGIGNPIAAIGGLFTAGIASILDSAKQQQRRIEEARAKVEGILDSYVDELADLNRFERLEATAISGAQEALAAIVSELFAGLPDKIREDLPDFQQIAEGLDVDELIATLEAFGEEGQKVAAELKRRLEDAAEQLQEAIDSFSDSLQIRKLEATGQEEAAAALRMRLQFEEDLAKAMELGDQALIDLVREVYELEKASSAAAEAAAAAAEAQKRREDLGSRIEDRSREMFGPDFSGIEFPGFDNIDNVWNEIRDLFNEGLLDAASVDTFLEDIREINDLLADGTIDGLDAIRLLDEILKQAGFTADEYADAIARAEEAARAAAEAEAFRAAQDLRSLEVRLLLAQGMDAEAQAMRNQIELLQAIEDGRSGEYLALLQQVQAAEAAAAARSKERAEIERTEKAMMSTARALNAPQGLRLSLLRWRSLVEDVPSSSGGIQPMNPAAMIQRPSADTAGPAAAAAAPAPTIILENVNLTSNSGESGEELLSKIEKAASRSVRRGGADRLRRRRS